VRTVAASVGFVVVSLLAASCRPAASPAATVAPSLVQVPGIRAKLLGTDEGGADVQLVFDPQAEVVQALQQFVEKNAWSTVHFVGLGACTDAVIAYYDASTREYVKMPLHQQMEIVSLVGDAAQGNNHAGFHAHIALGFADGTIHGGHLFEAHVAPTLELFVRASRVPMERRHDATFNAELLVP
jgi:predicted DNA-binding protein with PD1-like motif